MKENKKRTVRIRWAKVKLFSKASSHEIINYSELKIDVTQTLTDRDVIRVRRRKEDYLNSFDDGMGGCCVKKFLMVARPSFAVNKFLSSVFMVLRMIGS